MITWEEFQDAIHLTSERFDQTEKNSIKAAFSWAHELHNGQVRKFEDAPYFIHPIRVALLLIDQGSNMIIAALLHDILEKTDGTISQIENRFGTSVMRLVVGVSKIDGLSMTQAFDRVIEEEPRAVTLRVADRIDNLRTKYKFLPESRKSAYLIENRQIMEYIKRFEQTQLLDIFQNELSRLERKDVL